MPLSFNTNPYYDDFSSDKNYHRILFKAGYAVQARELTQIQSIQQDQITKFADNIFKPNSPVSGGQITTNLNCKYIKLQPTFTNNYGISTTLDIISLNGTLIQDISGSIIAKVIAVIPSTSTLGNPDTIVVSYISGLIFSDFAIIYNSTGSIVAQAILTNSFGDSSVVSIAQGVFYVSTTYKKSDGTDLTTGTFVQVNPQTIVLSAYTKLPSNRVGLNIVENIYTFVDDPSLLDPALGSSNYQAPGADRYKISLMLESRTLDLGNDDRFIELVRIENGQIVKMVDGSVYNVIDDYLAKRTYETNGDYVVNDFKLVPSTNLANTALYDLKIGKGTAFIRGYRVDNQSDITVTSNRARSTGNVLNNSTFMEYGNYLYINNLSSAFDVTGVSQIDMHIVANSSINTANTLAYQSTLAATAYIRNLEYVKYGSLDTANTYVYKAYITGIQNNHLTANANTATSNTISFTNNIAISNVANAYTGVILSIDSGTSKNDIRRVISSNGVTRTLYVDTPFTTTPDNTSVVNLRFGIKDIETLVHTANGTLNITASASISADSKDSGLLTGNTIIQEIVAPELIYSIGYPYVSGMTNTTYNTTVAFKNVSFTASGLGSAITLTFSAIDGGTSNLQFLGSTPENYIVFNTATGALIPFANTVARTISLGGGSYSVTLTAADVSPFTATVIAKASISAADNSQILRVKSLKLANTTGVNLSGTAVSGDTNFLVDTNSGQTYIKYVGIVTPGTPQDLYVSDVKRIVKIIDTLAQATAPTTAMLSDSRYDVTSNYLFDNGQRDGWYQHATITLRSGRPAALGQLLVCYDWYSHNGSTGYFSGASYTGAASVLPELYSEIPTYTAKSGMTYALRDCVDFRPAVVNYQKLFIFGTGSSAYSTNGSLIPTNNSTIRTNYSYYLARKDKLILSKDKNFTIVQGTPSTNPILPGTPDGALIIANLYLDPYTSYISNETPNGVIPSLSIERIQHKRWTMSDISDLQTRVNAVEYYTALNTLEKSAQSLQIPDVNGLNRFKYGILVDDFSSFSAADTNNIEFNVSINSRDRILSASQLVNNFPLHQLDLIHALDNLDITTQNSLGYRVNSTGKSNIFSLPYTSIALANQNLASNTINVNPYATPVYEGIMDINPSIDNWVDNTKQPDLLIIDPNLTLYQASATLNTLQTGDWKVIPGTQSKITTQTSVANHGAFNGPFGGTVGYTQTTTQTYAAQNQKNVLGYYQKLGSSYNQTGGYITDVSILPYIRAQQIVFNTHCLAINTPVSCWFDGVNVDQYITNPDIIELTNCVGTFSTDDVIGYYQSANFNPIAKVVSSYNYPGTANNRLYIIGNYQSSYVTDLPIIRIQNATFDNNGVYVGNTAYGTLNTSNTIITSHKSGNVTTVGGTFKDALSANLKLFKVWVGHGQFADTFGIWGSPRASGVQGLPSTRLNFTVPTTGTYYIRISTDDMQTGHVNINGTGIWTTSLQSGSYNDLPTAAGMALTAGVNYIDFQMTSLQDDGDAYFACAISSAPWTGPTKTTGTIIFSTDLIHKYATTLPSTAHTMITLPGGGLYFVGVTELSLNGISKNIDNYYQNSYISVSTQYIEVNQYTGVSTITPTTYNIKVSSYNAANSTVTLVSGINISLGYNSYVGGDITSKYSLTGTVNSYNLGIISGGLEKLSTDESGSICGVFNIPPSIFKTGDRVFQIDNRTVSTDPASATTYASSVFTASGLSTKSQAINFSPTISAAKNTFTQTKYKGKSLINTTKTYAPYDPIAQTFIIDSANYPNGAFISSIRLFFYSISTSNIPITLSIVGTQNGYPDGETLDNSVVVMYPKSMGTPSKTPHNLDPTTYVEFVFSAPVYIQPDVLYAFILHSVSTEYNVYIAVKGSTAISSTVKNLVSDVTPAIITKIGNVPYIGSLFVSQNAMTWTADQGQSIMFVINRCNFDTTKSPKIAFVVPLNLPYRKLTTQDITSYYNANNISNIFGSFAGKDVLSDAYNITTTEFIPTSSIINYTYQSTLNSSGLKTSESNITPGKFGCPTIDDLYLNDGSGPRILKSTSETSFELFAQLSSSDPIISPMLSDDGLSLYNIQWNINNLELSNNTVTIASGGTGYNVSTTTVSISYPAGTGGTQAYASANISSGSITSLNFSNFGSGYTTTPTITILDNATRAGNSNVSIVINGETSSSGGNGIAKYFTKKVVLAATGSDPADLRLFYTAYRPVGTNISIYYKILNRNDTQEFNAGYWQLMTNITNSNTYSTSRDNVIEFEAAPGINNTANNLISYVSTNTQTYTSFSQFAIKIVLSTSDNTNVPFLTDIRAIALPSGSGTF
jgi:hypothetical protein